MSTAAAETAKQGGVTMAGDVDICARCGHESGEHDPAPDDMPTAFGACAACDCEEYVFNPEWEQKMEKFREAYQAVKDFSLKIIEDPSILDNFDHTELAWLAEHFEMLLVESDELRKRIEEVLKANKEGS